MGQPLTLEESLDRLKRAQQPVAPSAPAPSVPTMQTTMPTPETASAPEAQPTAAPAPTAMPAPAAPAAPTSQPMGITQQPVTQPASEPGWKSYPINPAALGKPPEGNELELKNGMPQFRVDDNGEFLVDPQGNWVPRYRNREQENADTVKAKASVGGEAQITNLEQVRDAIERVRSNPSLGRVAGLGARGIVIPVPGTNGATVGGTIADVSATEAQLIGTIQETFGFSGEKAKNLAGEIMQAQADVRFITGSGVLNEMQQARTGSAQGATGFGNLTGPELRLLETVGSKGLDLTSGVKNVTEQLNRLDAILAKVTDNLRKMHNIPKPTGPGNNSPETLDAAKRELAKGARQ